MSSNRYLYSILRMKRVLVILPNAFEVFEGAAFIDVLGWANDCGNEAG